MHSVFAALFLTLQLASAAPTMTLAELYSKSYAHYAAATPSGTYKVTKKVMGESISAEVDIDDATTMDFALSGVIGLDCKKEAYSYDGKSAVTLPNSGTAGDCVHDALSKNNVALTSVTYDSTADTITIKVKYEGFMPLTFELTKQSRLVTLYRRKWSSFAAATPTGSYKVTKSIMGESITAEVDIDDATHMDFAISGPISLDCKKEVYSYDGKSGVTLPGAGTAGDCVHDALDNNNVALTSVDYDATGDTITVKVKYEGFMPLTLELTKVSTPTVESD